MTNISGRGVGLDVVRTNVESMGGSVDLQSEPGQSTTFRVKIPLTLAIVSVLLVRADDHRIAIPQASVVELIRVERDGGKAEIEDLGGVPVYRLRGKLLPLVFLDRELGVAQIGSTDGKANIIVLQGDDRQFGLVVAGVEDSQEIVVKPLGRLLSGLPFAGATILGDGQIALILDVFRLGLSAGVVSESRVPIPAAAQISSAVKARAKTERLWSASTARTANGWLSISIRSAVSNIFREHLSNRSATSWWSSTVTKFSSSSSSRRPFPNGARRPAILQTAFAKPIRCR